jgi:hypothetical protein
MASPELARYLLCKGPAMGAGSAEADVCRGANICHNVRRALQVTAQVCRDLSASEEWSSKGSLCHTGRRLLDIIL